MTPDSGNNRVTNAIIATKLDNLIDRVDGYCEQAAHLHATHDQRIRELERTQAAQGEQIKGLSGRVNAWNVTNSAGAVLAGIIGWFK